MSGGRLCAHCLRDTGVTEESWSAVYCESCTDLIREHEDGLYQALFGGAS